MLLKLTLLIFITTLSLFSQDNTSQENPSYLDTKHQELSDMIIDMSDSIDDGINFFAEDDKEERIYIDDASVDSFFQNKKFLDETDNAFIRVRMKGLVQSKDEDDAKVSVRAQIPLSRTQKSLKLFVESFSDNEQNQMTTQNNDNVTTPQVGLHYFNPKRYGIESRYSLGTKGINPYIRARYKKVVEMAGWTIEPTQSFKYSTKTDFSEDTNIYLDKNLDTTSLFRVELQRGTESRLKGMNYGLGLTYFETINKQTGFSMSQGFFGNTKYTYALDTVPVTDSSPYGGLNNYVTSANWRQNVWKKWFYYEVRPSVNFHRQHDYKANYSLLINLDFYFGRFGTR